LAAVLRRDQAYRQVTVDSNQGCRRCGLRYLCGGFCRAWGSGDDPNTPPEDCTALQARVRLILESALVTLDVTRERWLAAKLPVA
jgi:sulfatase maturation enzyme AslB (radical SAM superfamily)